MCRSEGDWPPTELERISLVQLGLVFERGRFAAESPEPGVYDLQVVFEPKPVAVTVVDRQGVPWPGIELWAADLLLGRANSKGLVVFDERLIRGRANLMQLELRAARYGVGYPVAPESIEMVDETTVRILLEQEPARLRVRARVDTLDLGEEVSFGARLFLQEATEESRFGSRLPIRFSPLLPGTYTLHVQRPGQADYVERLQVDPGAEVEVLVPVTAGQAWAEMLRIARRGGLSAENAHRAAVLARMLGRDDLVGLFE